MSNIEPTIDDYLDRIAELNKLGYPDLDGACNICGVHPDALKALISDQVAKAKLEAFDVAFDCHDYDRLRAYRAKLLKGVK